MGTSTAVVVPNLRRWRISRALLQRQLAQASGVDERTIQRLEAGRPAGLETVARLSTALNVQPTDLMSDKANLR